MRGHNKLKGFIFPGVTPFYAARVAIVALSAWLFFSYLCIPIRIQGESMEPAYADGVWNLVWRPAYLFSSPERGDVAAVRFAGTRVMLLKRVVALEGEEVEFRGGTLFVDGKEIDEPYVKLKGRWELSPRKVEEGNVYLVGDNRGVPMGRHTFGQTSAKRIVGAPLF